MARKETTPSPRLATGPGSDEPQSAPIQTPLIQALEALIRDLAHDPALAPDDQWLVSFCRGRNRGVSDVTRHVKKRALLPCYLGLREQRPELLSQWGVDDAIEERLITALRAKPRRTASGVATITVIAKPWPCSGACRFCPNDLRMPKSYLANEPACQRAEQCWFDPYLQTSGRLEVLAQMGHPIDKIELIVLGGTWTEYEPGYQRWFTAELFRALNDGVGPGARFERTDRTKRYQEAGLPRDPEVRAREVREAQTALDAGTLTYNQGFSLVYGPHTAWDALRQWQTATSEAVAKAQARNERASSRCVGLSFETRPDAVTPARLRLLRELGCTKVQIGVQSTYASRLAENGRPLQPKTLEKAFALLRLFGFKIHAHAMVNLLGGEVEADKKDYRRLMNDPRFEPDEVKLYPCALIGGTALARDHAEGRWRPYSLAELLDVLETDVRQTPRWVRVSRMIRDFSSQDILAGNKQANLRQRVEADLRDASAPVREVRFREVGLGAAPDGRELRLRTARYGTCVSEERFLEWVDERGTLHGFLRLSLPFWGEVPRPKELPVGPGEAMIREVHVYGRVSRLRETDAGSQHRGLGRALVAEACRQAAEAGYGRINVISAVGTREYYRGLGFGDCGLYQTRSLGS